jgi:long-chain acyl-CoA synthetase
MKNDSYPDPAAYGSLVELLDDVAQRYPADRPLLSLRTDAGLTAAWSSAEVRRRARIAAWRLRSAGLAPGDRLLTWSPSTPMLPAVYWGAMIAGVVFVPLDLRMAPAVLVRIASRAGTDTIAVGGEDDAPDVEATGLGHLKRLTLEALVADFDPTEEAFAADWEAQLDGWPRPDRDGLVEIVYTSGTTSQPKGVKLTHGTFLSTLEVCRVLIPSRHHRMISILPLSHLFEQAIVLFYGSMLGAEITYVRSVNPRTLFEVLREQRATTMVVAPQILQLFWTALTREVDRQGKRAAFDRARSIARRLPMRARRLLFRGLHAQLGGELTLFAVAGAYLPPELQRDWEDLGITIVQGYGSTECGPAACNDERDHPVGVVGRTIPPVTIKLADEDAEILISGPTVSPGYWDDEEATAAAFDADGWYRTGDIGRFDEDGRLVLAGRKKNIIVLPNGLNVFPEDLENLLSDRGLDQAVVLETRPGRIEAVVMPPGTTAVMTAGRGGQEPRSEAKERVVRAAIDGIVKAVNAELPPHARIDSWRMWPEPDFPRTHTLKVRRDAVREWIGADVPLEMRDDSTTDDRAVLPESA